MTDLRRASVKNSCQGTSRTAGAAAGAASVARGSRPPPRRSPPPAAAGVRTSASSCSRREGAPPRSAQACGISLRFMSLPLRRERRVEDGRRLDGLLPLEELHDEDVEERDEEDGEEGARLSMPPRTLVPIAFCAPAPAPVASASGRTPKPKASEVMTIGRSRVLAASSVASTRPIPFSRLLRRRTGRSGSRSSSSGRGR